MTDRSKSSPSSTARRSGGIDWMRHAVLLIAVILFVVAVVVRQSETAAGGQFFGAACFRIGLVFAAVWLAWDSLRRPARWFPPVALMAGLGVLAAIAAQPRLALVMIPAAGAIVAIGAVVRGMRQG
ncbi:hypothetical protein [Crateriforma spongiae]|uniref:hypothetical protein n=1 Tax=Crateriforma spongiae TaxID=2724528 RepID=UPI0014483098|nr:hypothetical protein [Crateriforma spongiae]